MKTIPFKDALKLLDRALDINVPGYTQTTSFVLQTEEGADHFLELELEDENHEFFFAFKESDNQTVKVDGDTMTLLYTDAVVDDVEPSIEIRLMIPMPLETPPEATPTTRMKLSIEVSAQLDQEAVATVFGEVGKTLREADMESKELMDGSYRIETTHGPVFLNIDQGEG